jgi:hypothetical protein
VNATTLTLRTCDSRRSNTQAFVTPTVMDIALPPEEIVATYGMEA